MRDHVVFFLNGQAQHVAGRQVLATLSEHLRWQLGLCGTKVVCAEGDCGACTVLVGRSDGQAIRYLPVDSCIQFVFQVDGAHVVTVEGLASNTGLHPIQHAMCDHHGSQCGYCTPGFVMALAGWAANGASLANIPTALTGNLCRCTGYLPILGAARDISSTKKQLDLGQWNHLQEQLNRLGQESLLIKTDGRTVYAPTQLADAFKFKAAHPDAVIIAGSTELGVLRNKKDYQPSTFLCLSRIAELSRVAEADSLSIGANVTWSQLEPVARRRMPQFQRVIERFGAPQIRHVATVVGNVAHGSPIADSLPFFFVMEAVIEIASVDGLRQRCIDGFYSGYKQKDLQQHEIITRIVVPWPDREDRLRLYKVSRRIDLDIATFCAAIRITMAGDTIANARIAFGGVAPTVVRLPQTEQFLIGQECTEEVFLAAGRIARNEVTPIGDVRGAAAYRLQLCENVLMQFYFDECAAEAAA